MRTVGTCQITTRGSKLFAFTSFVQATITFLFVSKYVTVQYLWESKYVKLKIPAIRIMETTDS
uniref:Uncharacterized protein n=1 Tax=Anguilla anguilla TaxID=7936 RepID=A0A0E9Q2N9_ANGAN